MNIARTIADRIFRPIVQYSPIEKPRYVVFTSTDVRRRNDDEKSKIKVRNLLDYVLRNHDMYNTADRHTTPPPPKDTPECYRQYHLPDISSLLLDRARKTDFANLSVVNQEHMRRTNSTSTT